MKYDTVDDKEYFFTGAALGGKKALFTNFDKRSLYKKNSINTPAVDAGVAVKQVTSGANALQGKHVTGTSLLGNATATLALNWADASLNYSQRNRNNANSIDDSSFVSRLLHAVITDDNDYATGGVGYDVACSSSLDLWQLIDYSVSRKNIVAANYCSYDVLRPGDVLFFSENVTNAMLLHITGCGIYVGDALMVRASNKQRAVITSGIDTSKVNLVARPFLFINDEEGLDVPDEMLDVETLDLDGQTYSIPVFKLEKYLICESQDNS